MNKAVFLDRDGTINVEKHYLYRKEDFQYREGVIEGLKKLLDIGFILVIVTNQSGIARGYYSEDDLKELNSWMIEDLASKGVEIAGIYYCPHYPDAIVERYKRVCDCRKPKTGLFWKAVRDLDIDLDHSFAIGDKSRDLGIIDESGARGVLITDEEQCFDHRNSDKCKTCGSFGEAVKIIEAWSEE